jgi:hypothetical protein
MQQQMILPAQATELVELCKALGSHVTAAKAQPQHTQLAAASS